ncbi:transposase [Paraburkholderia sp. CNPSo 3274]|nr:transposase [Paraburkholderia sp. CNPSo 3274]MCP3713186.1 transposase [Paraburkholderia sp. CNPSo 3274]
MRFDQRNQPRSCVIEEPLKPAFSQDSRPRRQLQDFCRPSLNNVIEQDHRAVKRIIKPMMGFKNFRCARIILAGIEIMHMISKGQLQENDISRTAADQFYSLMI